MTTTQMGAAIESVGSIGLIHTVTVLERAAGGEHLPDRNTMRDLYGRSVPILDHGINVDEIPEPHRLAERGW